jgi:hypothetical protein
MDRMCAPVLIEEVSVRARPSMPIQERIDDAAELALHSKVRTPLVAPTNPKVSTTPSFNRFANRIQPTTEDHNRWRAS